MTRGLHSDLQTELATDHLDQIHLVQFTIGGTTYYRTTGYFDIVYDSNTYTCLLYTSPSPRDGLLSRMPSSA